MPDISFASFNPRSFEQFSQALASLVLGQGLLVFGDGPDGGREAAFSGKVPYPTILEPWDGHVVVQAKFHVRVSNDGKDADWLVAQIAAEVDRVATLEPRPDYYLLVTNVRLSGATGAMRKGGQQKVREAFDRHLKPLGVKELHVWHEEKIATLLDAYPDLLRSYGAWLAPREVLAGVFAQLADATPDFGGTMLRLLQREFREQRDTRLRQAGHVGDDPTPIESVFVDLPYGGAFDLGFESRMELLAEARHQGSAGGLCADLLTLTSMKLDPVSAAQAFPDRYGPPPVRHLVLGGPGQGKSTISQFLAQVARCRLLHDVPRHQLSRETLPIMDAMMARMAEVAIPVEGPRRYPLKVDLPTFADALARAEHAGTSLSLLDFLADRISSAANSTGLNAAVMRRWLGTYPWLLILDGLDEVPPSGNRRRLLKAISDFWDEATPVGADVAMVVTSRPQGYNDDLDPALHVKHEMLRLDAAQALAYARGVAKLKIVEEDRREAVLDRLKAAAENPTTALLMVSPLQVAILLQLVEQRGSAPTDRWTLFEEYLGVVVKREQEKRGEAGRVVREHQFVIDGMLRRAGLLLHVEAERQFGAEGFLSAERLHDLARQLLVEEGHEHVIANGLAREIVAAATDRLVFLEQRVEGRIEFQVRSLQEFMAAAELMAGADYVVGERLHAIAGRNHWQHVYRIAASKAFSKRDAAKYRDTVIAANARLQTADPAASATQRGGMLARALLEDGVAHQQPVFRRVLLDQALGLLRLGSENIDEVLLSLLRHEDGEDGLRALRPRLDSSAIDERLAAWGALFALVRHRGDAADRIATEAWPTDMRLCLAIATSTLPPTNGTDARGLLEAAFSEAGPLEITLAMSAAGRSSSGRSLHSLCVQFPYLAALRSAPAKSQCLESTLGDATGSPIRLRLVTLDGGQVPEYLATPPGRAWDGLADLRTFAAAPGLENLARFVESLGMSGTLEAVTRMALPWVAGTLANLADHGADPCELARAVREGRFGIPSDWRRAEQRWRGAGISDEDVAQWRRGTYFNADVALVGAPFAHTLIRSNDPKARGEWLLDFIRSIGSAPDGAPTDQMRRIATFALGAQPLPRGLNAAEIGALLGQRTKNSLLLRADAIGSFASEALEDRGVRALLADLGRRRAFSLAPANCEITAGQVEALASPDFLPGMFELACAVLGARPAMLRAFARSVLPALKATAEPATVLLRYLAESATAGEAATACTRDGRENVEQHAILAVAEHDATEVGDAVTLLTVMVDRLDRRAGQVRNEALATLNRLLDERTSDLRNPLEWKRLALPTSLFDMLENGHLMKDAVGLST